MASEILLTINKSSYLCSLQSNFKIIGIRSSERSCGDVKTIKSGKISGLGSDKYEKHSIVYISASIEEATIVRTLTHTDIKDFSYSHSWNY